MSDSALLDRTTIETDSSPDHSSRNEQPLLDRQNRVVAVVAGWPLGWDGRTERATAAMEVLYEKLRGYAWPTNRRGEFLTCATGFSYGMGQPVSQAHFELILPQLTAGTRNLLTGSLRTYKGMLWTSS